MSKEDERVLALFGRNIVKLRNGAGLTVVELGEHSRLGTEKVEQFERGEVPATLVEMRKLAAVLGVNLPDLVRLEPHDG
jgi:transcriptional regulator with XRE-family HTH domain